MNEGFDLSFKNKIVRVCFWIMIPAVIAAVCLILFTDFPSIFPTLLPVIAWITFFIWLYFYKRKQKKEEYANS